MKYIKNPYMCPINPFYTCPLHDQAGGKKYYNLLSEDIYEDLYEDKYEDLCEDIYEDIYEEDEDN